MICVAFLIITFQFIITQVQIFLAIGMGYFFLGFGGSRWTTNYVERYFAYSVASGTKLMVLYMLAGAAWPLTRSWVQQASSGLFGTARKCGDLAGSSCAVLFSMRALFGSVVHSFPKSLVDRPISAIAISFLLWLPLSALALALRLIAAGVFTAGATSVVGAAGMAAGCGRQSRWRRSGRRGRSRSQGCSDSKRCGTWSIISRWSSRESSGLAGTNRSFGDRSYAR